MTLKEVINILLCHHHRVLFRCDRPVSIQPGLTPRFFGEEWKGAVIVSASGNILAFQIGHCCEWRLSATCYRVADDWEINDADWPIGPLFTDEFEFNHKKFKEEHI